MTEGSEAYAPRLQQHWDAGADHVCIQPLSEQGFGAIDEAVLEALAPAA
jgi:hypothetical protein